MIKFQPILIIYSRVPHDHNEYYHLELALKHLNSFRTIAFLLAGNIKT